MYKKTISVFFLLFTILSCSAKIEHYSVKVLETYPHDKSAYTQGLFFWNGSFYETTGQWGGSSIRSVDLESGHVKKKLNLSSKYFGEGSTAVEGKLYMLTWTNKLAFVYDIASMKYLKTLSYPREGWGLTSIPAQVSERFNSAVMVASDGSANLYFLDSELRTLKTLQVTVSGKPMRLLNELEWIDGKIWANVYTTDVIVIINPESGAVEAAVDCSSLIPQARRTREMDVLNGIAQGPDGSIYLTGKNWPSLFKIKLVKEN